MSHKGEHYEGEHEAIIATQMWDDVQKLITERRHAKPRTLDTKPKNAPYLLRGIIFDSSGWAMTPSDGGKNKRRRYRYYVSTRAIKHGYDSVDVRSIPAEQIEPIIIGQLRKFFVAPEVIHRTHQRAQLHEPNITVEEVRKGLAQFDEIWEQLFPLEQNRIMQLIVRRIQVSVDGITITYHPNGIMDVYEQITSKKRA
jgi:hypothetical protein